MKKIKWKLPISLVLLMAVLIINVSGCSSNQKTSNSAQEKNNPVKAQNKTSISLKSVTSTVVTAPNQMHMFDEQNGYGCSFDHPVMVTSNGGATWIDVTPKIPGNDSGESTMGYFVNARTGWTFRLQPEKSVTVYSTEDGGQSWSKLVTVPVKYGDGGMSIVFSDVQHGWFEEMTAGHVPFSSDGELFATCDGGKTWERVADSNFPFVGLLTAQKDGTLWLSGTEILKSTNGGKTWSQVNMPLSAVEKKETTSITKPVFFGKNGFVTVQFQGGDWVLYATQDAGQIWSVRGTFPHALRGVGVVYDFINSLDGWAINNSNNVESSGKVLYITHDGGYSWQKTLTNMELKNDYVKAIDFVNSKVGWMTYNHNTETGPKPFIAKSTNGGMSWKILK